MDTARFISSEESEFLSQEGIEKKTESLSRMEKVLTNVEEILSKKDGELKDFLRNLDPVEALEKVQAFFELREIYLFLNLGEMTEEKLKEEFGSLALSAKSEHFIKSMESRGLLIAGDEVGQKKMIETYLSALPFFKSFIVRVIKIFSDVKPEEVQEIARVLAEVTEESIEKIESKDTPKCFEGFSPDQISCLLEEVFSIELNSGCSVQCSFCAFGAERKKRGSDIPFSDLAWIFKRATKMGFLYYASDPLDYEYTDNKTGKRRTYKDVLLLFRAIRNQLPSTTTAVPRKRENVFREVSGLITRVSLSDSNRKHLAKDGVFEFTEKGSAIPKDLDMFFSMLFPYAKSSFRKANNMLDGERRGVVVLSGRQLDQKPIAVPLPDSSIACYDGVLIKPGGIYNSIALPSSKVFRKGMVEVRIDPNRFNKESIRGFITEHRLRDSQGDDLSIEDFEDFVSRIAVANQINYGAMRSFGISYPGASNYTRRNAKFNLGKDARIGRTMFQYIRDDQIN